jgi:hypothetical protein
MMQPFLVKRIGKRPDHVLLSGQLGKGSGAPFAGKDLGLGHDIGEVICKEYCRQESLTTFCAKSKNGASRQ